jgi:hypothetical protein
MVGHLGLVSPGYVLGLEEVLRERRLGFCVRVRGDFGVELRPVRNPRFFEHPRSTRYSKKDTSKIRSNGPLPPSNRCRAFTRNDLLGRHQARNDENAALPSGNAKYPVLVFAPGGGMKGLTYRHEMDGNASGENK